MNGHTDSLCSRQRHTIVYVHFRECDIFVVFVLRAGFPRKIRKRWVERIVTGQLPNGGWDGSLLFFTSDSRPSFGSPPPSSQHGTILALTALYLVRYQYPEHFGLK